MDWISLATQLVHLHAFLLLAGAALSPSSVFRLPPVIQALCFEIGGVLVLGLLGVLCVALDPGDSAVQILAWGGVGAIGGTRLLLRWRSRTDGEPWIRFTTDDWLRVAAMSTGLLLALAYGTHLMSLAGSPPYDPNLSWRQMTQRSYPLFDGDLQHLVADAFLSDQSVEKNFYDKGSPWSAGDRPMLVATLYAAAARLTGAPDLTSYRLIVMLLASIAVLAVFALLHDFLEIRAGPGLLLTCVFALHPFFVANIEFTWPKMSGAGFALAGFVLAHHALARLDRDSFAELAFPLLLGGVGIGLAPVAHGTLFVGSLCLLAILLFIDWREIRSSSAKAAALALLLAPLVLFVGMQSLYSSAQTQSSNLGVRVALCREGSFIQRSPAMGIGEACSRYLDRVGIEGVVGDRMKSLHQAFVVGYEDFAEPYALVTGFGELQRAYTYQVLYTPVYAYGFWSLPLLIMASLACAHSRMRSALRRQRKTLAIFLAGWFFLLLFAAMMGEWPEVRAYQIPMTQHILIFTGSWALALGLAPRFTLGAATLYLMFCLAIVLGDDHVFRVESNPIALLASGGAFALACAGLYGLRTTDDTRNRSAA